MKFLIDLQLPIQLAIHLRERGHDCLHVIDTPMAASSDLALWEAAKTQSRVVVSKDEDFVFLANRVNETGRLVWIRLGNCRNAVLIAAFDRVHDSMIAALSDRQRIVEIR